MRMAMLVVSLTILMLPATALAEDCSRQEMAAAKPHFEVGAKAFRVGELHKAADEFKAAYEACPSPLFLYNLGQTHRQLKDDEKALYFYKQFLATTQPHDERREDVERWIATLEARIDSQHQSQRPVAPGAAPQATVTSPVVPAAATPLGDASVRRVEQNRGASATPTYKKWWVWTLVGVAAVGIGVGVALAVEQSRSAPYTAPAVTF